MKMKVLAGYGGDDDYGDCILLNNQRTLIVYDCGHEKHTESIIGLLEQNTSIVNVSIVVSHSHRDHTDGIANLFEYLSDANYKVTVYTALYLKDADKILEILDDDRRTLPATRKRILGIFDSIEAIVNTATSLGFSVETATEDTTIIHTAYKIVGPTEDEFVAVVAKAIESDGDESIDGETVMNAASVQLTGSLENGKRVLLSGDATPEYIHNLENYRIVQLPHHGKLNSAETIFGKISSKSISEYIFIISDNTGTSNGGSDDLMASDIRKGKDIRNTNVEGDLVIAIPRYKSFNDVAGNYGVCDIS